MKIAGWGRFPVVDAPRRAMRDATEARAVVDALPSLIARGNGRSYGDAALNADGVLSTLPADRILSFDATTGDIACEAGLLLADLLAFAVPRGWFVPVSPGTKYVTIGGMIAAGVHGKNHHMATASFSAHRVARWMRLLTADGTLSLTCSAQRTHADLFWATCRGGMGLTGHHHTYFASDLKKIETSYIRQEAGKAPANWPRQLIDLFEAVPKDYTYSVAWIDCLKKGGRSLVYLGEHATRGEAPGVGLVVPTRRAKRVPLDFPGFALNRLSLRAFNELYWRAGKPGTALVDYDRYFYPLDAVLEWNRIYGRRGFVQYQCVLPQAASAAGLDALLRRIVAAGSGSFLAVLKLFGAASDGLLSFPTEGYTLALDFPAHAGSFNLLLDLDAITAAHGGRLYLAKDARMGAAMLRQGYPRLDQFRAVRAAVGPCTEIRFAAVPEARPVTEKSNVLIVGATSDIGRAIARAFAGAGHPLVLAARRPEALDRDAEDLRLRHFRGGGGGGARPAGHRGACRGAGPVAGDGGDGRRAARRTTSRRG